MIQQTKEIFKRCLKYFSKPPTNRLNLEQVINYQKQKRTVEIYKDDIEKNDSIAAQKVYQSFFRENPLYNKLQNKWKNKLINKQKYKERKRLRDEQVVIVEDQPKLVLHKDINNIENSFDSLYNTFGVIKLRGRQFKVTQDDLLRVDRIPELSVGQLVQINDVLLIGSQDYTILGRPIVTDAKVFLRVEEQTRTQQLMSFKKRRRKQYKRMVGFNHKITVFRVEKIETGLNKELMSKAILL